jgi:hypothetical protein
MGWITPSRPVSGHLPTASGSRAIEFSLASRSLSPVAVTTRIYALRSPTTRKGIWRAGFGRYSEKTEFYGWGAPRHRFNEVLTIP